jgi:hypothetical protein
MLITDVSCDAGTTQEMLTNKGKVKSKRKYKGVSPWSRAPLLSGCPTRHSAVLHGIVLGSTGCKFKNKDEPADNTPADVHHTSSPIGVQGVCGICLAILASIHYFSSKF